MVDTALPVLRGTPRNAEAIASRRETGAHGAMAELLQLMGAPACAVHAMAADPVRLRCLHAGDTLFHEGAASVAIYFVRAGTFKLCRTGEDGYEQVLGFAGRAEVLGFDALGAAWNHCAAVALEDSSVYLILQPALMSLVRNDPEFSLVIHRAASNAISGQRVVADVMAAVAAEVKLARFLMHTSQRMTASAQSPRRLLLRMSRREIASFLGVAHETVSRAMSLLSTWDLIRVDNRDIEILDMHRLAALSRATRRGSSEVGRDTQESHPGAAAEPSLPQWLPPASEPSRHRGRQPDPIVA